MSDDPQKMGLGCQNAICASTSPYLSANCDGVFVIFETTRSFRSVYRRWRSACPLLRAQAVRYFLSRPPLLVGVIT